MPDDGEAIGAKTAVATRAGRYSPGKDATLEARRMVDRSRDAAIATDGTGRICFWNKAAARLVGDTAPEDIDPACSPLLQAGRPLHLALQSRDVFGNRLGHRDNPLQSMLEAGEAIQSFEIDVTRADQCSIRLSVSIVVVIEEGQSFFIHLLQERKRRRRSDELIDRLLAQAHDDTSLSDLDLGVPLNPGGKPQRQPAPRLTPREKQVLRLLANGHSTDQIADDLHISIHTVRRHCQNLMRKMGIHSKVEAVALALRRRLI